MEMHRIKTNALARRAYNTRPQVRYTNEMLKDTIKSGAHRADTATSDEFAKYTIYK